ncbi:hypothetical protein Bca52824_011014 [Brassica carinata]|uniref:Reverse transcriptase zinc-binding domain-containing protein n=1 Tax=Brassica carinata TaxID=52824 RepID=A0A8X7WEX9_BRACI|nr:hypothetical protein Bca52824_011014 [Brassica carinata]
MIEFWWGGNAEKRKISLVAWKNLYKPKELGGMGFKDFAWFNQALLCKQDWRIWSKPQSLLARVMKSRYFKDGSFLECGIGTRPSYAWCSIMHGKELLVQGLMKKIGDGQSTNIWYDSWILLDVPRPPRYRIDDVDLSLIVSELIDMRYSNWNAQRVRHLFVEEDANHILGMKIDLSRPDSMIWGLERNGTYSSKSGYKLLETLQEVNNPSLVTLPPLEKRLWSNLWKVKTLPKIRHFLLKALAGALAVADQLRNRGLHIDPICRGCQSAPETICHVLFHCHTACEVWRLSGFPLPPVGFSLNSVVLNFQHLIHYSRSQTIPQHICLMFPWVLWHIWKGRNELIFANTPCWSSYFYGESSDFVKCNIDSSWISDAENTGASSILRNHLGESLVHSRRSYSSVSAKLEAELLSFSWAIDCSLDLRFDKVVFEYSSYLAGEASIRPEDFPCYQGLLAHIRFKLEGFRLWNISYVPIEGNRCAHEIALSVTRDHRYHSYIAHGGPFWLQTMLLEEAKDDTQILFVKSPPYSGACSSYPSSPVLL